jgi:hypothetical protein
LSGQNTGNATSLMGQACQIFWLYLFLAEQQDPIRIFREIYQRNLDDFGLGLRSDPVRLVGRNDPVLSFKDVQITVDLNLQKSIRSKTKGCNVFIRRWY